MKPKIYLAGWTGEKEYRQYCKDNHSYKFELIDPLVLIPEDAGDRQNYTEIVCVDKEAIRKCNGLLAYITRPSFGTSMELLFAYDVVKIPIIIVNPDGDWKDDPWLRYHSDFIVDKIDEAFYLFIKYFNL